MIMRLAFAVVALSCTFPLAASSVLAFVRHCNGAQSPV
jgi:hypothetical protein